MPLLYEHYVLGLLREAYGNQIRYQEPGHTGYPDFICYDPLLVMDTKYIPRFKDKTKISSDIHPTALWLCTRSNALQGSHHGANSLSCDLSRRRN